MQVLRFHAGLKLHGAADVVEEFAPIYFLHTINFVRSVQKNEQVV